ncbi:Trm112 family protein [Candidatus Xiphinematobacter sp. Idaho Grape]|uniref:Trm112 family protein n=1 Tax=Candidatus Xiphinematobacter sp. Idaho Grape TaxID=1704307 RepID=UPI00130D8185|nr:Trm112 family protein [Candidatus Xiphinematobacter sp. Idaho Grape]
MREAGALELEELNLRVCSGTLLNQLGQTVCQPLKAALIREDGNVAYPVRDDIPFLLLEEAITI